MKRGVLIQNCLIGLFSVFLVLLCLELGLRAFDLLKHGDAFFSSAPRNLLAEHPQALIPFRMFGFPLYQQKAGVQYISSRWGELYPMEKPKGSFRIVCFGGSTTEQAVDGKHYPLMLQSLLRERLKRDNIDVINVGNSAYATPHFLIMLEMDAIYWKPDLVILSENINDLLTEIWPNFAPDYSNSYQYEYFTMPNYAARYSLPNLIFRHSRLYWFLQSEWQRITVHQKSLPIRRESYGDTPNPLAANVFEQNLRTFIEIARSHGIKVLLATQPLQPSEEYFARHYAYKPYNNIVFYPLHDEFVKHHRFYNDIIRRVAATTGVPFVDNDRMMGGKEENFIDSVHYTKLGLERLAQSYAGFMIEHRVVSDGAGVEQ